MTTPDQIAAAILATLATTAPQLSCAVGTPERQILEACAAQIAAAYIGQYLTGGMMDINTKSGLELDQFCLAPGTPVVTPSGITSIENLHIGDRVLTHKGQTRKILATSMRAIDENIVTIRTASGVEHTMTKNHPVWATKKSWMTMLASQVGNWRRDGSKGSEHAFRLRGLGNKTVWDSRELKRDFITAGDLEPGDIVWGPTSDPMGSMNNISIEEKRLIGYYLAEGHALVRERGMSDIGFSFHEDEIEYQKEVSSLLKSVWGISHINIAKSGLGKTKQVKCYDNTLATSIINQFGKGAANKHIPWNLFNSSEDLVPILATYWRGDGTASINGQSMSAKTVSRDLAHQIFTILIRLGLAPRLTMEKGGGCTILGRRGTKLDAWRISVDGPSAKTLSEIIDYPLRYENTKNYCPSLVHEKEWVGSAIVSIKEFSYQGNVHNVEVEGDNSYVLMGHFGVHNCGIFGFGRLQGTPASGTIQLTLTNVDSTSISVPLNSQFSTTPGLAGLTTTLYYASTQAVTIPAGTSQISVPVQCTTVGTQGNVPPDSVTSQAAAVGSVIVTNLAAMTGGTNVETDAQLRQRFMDTLLRNISGTSDWYTNLALQNNNVSRVAVYGPVSLYATQIVVPESTLTLELNSDVKYVWSGGNSCFTDLGTSSETFYSPVDDYNLSSGASPVFTTEPDGALTPGQIVDLEFQYTTQSSRNDPANGITNKVDIFVDGVAPFMVTETTVVTATTLSSTSTNVLYTGNFRRVGATGSPSSSNRFMRLGNTPIVNFPSTITVGDVVYTQNTHYYLLQGITTLRGSQLEVAGLEWLSGGAPNSTQLVLNYTYNQVPQLLDAVMASSKQICTDVLNHVAEYQYITTCLTVEYSRNYAITTTNTAIVARLQIFYQTLGFGAPVIFSQLEAAVQQVLGVNEVHVTTEAEDGDDYGIQVFANSTDVDPTTVYTDDFVLNDNQLAVYQNTITLQAPNIGGGGS